MSRLRRLFGLVAGLSLLVLPCSQQSISHPLLKVDYEIQDSFEQSLFILINSRRLKEGLPALITTTVLMDVAEAHSLDMAARDYLAHINPEELRANDRLDNADYRYIYYGEVIAGGTFTPADTLNGWLGSPGHKDVLLDGRYREMGIGFAYNDRTTYWNYWTVVVTVPED